MFILTDRRMITSTDDHKLLQESYLTVWQTCKVHITLYI